MADYTQSVDFAAKDDLPRGNAAKVVSGTEINTEFANIETAIATKVDETGGTATGLTLSGTTTISSADINGGAIDAVTIGATTPATTLDVDNININGNTISSTDTVGDGNIIITPNGSGEVDISKVDIDGGAIDGTTIGASTPSTVVATTATATDLVVDTNVFVVDGTTNDNVGIGTASPDSSYKLDVSGNVRATEFHGDASNVTGINIGYTWVDAGSVTSGSTKDLTIDTTNVTEIIVLLKNLQGSGDTTNDAWQLLLGDSGGVETSNYHSFYNGTSDSGFNVIAFNLCERTGSASETYGIIKLYNASGNDWFMEASMSQKQGATSLGTRSGAIFSTGFKSLSSALTTVQVKAFGGNFTSGNIYYGTKGSG